MELNVVVINLSVKSGVSHSLLISLSSHSLRKNLDNFITDTIMISVNQSMRLL